MSDYVPAEVVAEILSRLPVKSVLRFRCVCKQWRSLISNPNFTAKHLSRSPTHTLLRYYSKTFSKEIYALCENRTRISFPFHTNSRFYFLIVGSCNGLICLADDMFGLKGTIILWNPSIRRSLTLPPPRVLYDRYGPYMSVLGFGFDSRSSDFKVVRLGYLLPDEDFNFKVPPKVEVYSVSLGKWRKVKTKIESFIPERFWSQAVIEGVVHWNAYDMISDGEGILIRTLILAFDLGSEEFSKLDLPDALATKAPFTVLPTVLNGSLSVVHYDASILCFMMGLVKDYTVWVMEEYGNVDSWTQRYKIELDRGSGMVVGLRREAEILLSSSLGHLVSYNCGNRSVTRTGIHGTPCSFFMADYVESFALLDKGKETLGIEPEVDTEDVDGIVELEELRFKESVLTHTMTAIFG